jgi:hypothetical protein
VAFLSTQIDPHDRIIEEAPLFITTPFQRPRVAEIAGERSIVQLILARDILDQIAHRLAAGPVLIVAPSEEVAVKIRRAIERGLLPDARGHARITVPADSERLVDAAKDAACVFLWPGAPGWVVRDLEALDCVIPGRCIADESLAAVRSAVLDCAMRLIGRPESIEAVSTSNVSAPRVRTVAFE